MSSGAMKSVGVIGSGVVGSVLSNAFLKEGYPVMRGTREPSKLEEWLNNEADPKEKASVGTFEEAAKSCEILVLAVGGSVAGEALDLCGIDNLRGKVIIDATNPIGGGPEDGVLQFFAGCKDSLMETLQAKAPEARFVKAFSCVGNQHMYKPTFESKPTMFICGNDKEAKDDVKVILDKFGWDYEDMGTVKAARCIEPLCQLWCLPLFINGESGDYAFKLLRK